MQSIMTNQINYTNAALIVDWAIVFDVERCLDTSLGDSLGSR